MFADWNALNWKKEKKEQPRRFCKNDAAIPTFALQEIGQTSWRKYATQHSVRVKAKREKLLPQLSFRFLHNVFDLP